jgi:hypothetical protein
MNKQNFNLTNGYPLNQASLDRMQTAYDIFNSLGWILGDKSIITGCVLTGSNVSNGVVFVNGEVFEFRGGAVQTEVVIKEDTTNLVYKNSNAYPAVKTRYVTFGSGVGSMPWEDFKVGFPTREIAGVLADKEDKTTVDALIERIEDLEARNVPLIQITSGQDPVESPQQGYNTNFQFNYVDVYPPAGYNLSHLAGFMPSINAIDFEGDVDSNDYLYCQYKNWPIANPDRIRVICSNTETGAASKVNWMAVWIKY